jgi:geranylgeranyl diphosphate synthase type I
MAGDDIEEYLTEIGHELRPFLQRAIDRVPDVAALKEGVVSQVLGGGKRIRAALCATVCEVFSGDRRRALPFAAAIEHLQNFTLIHDDIADGDEERRNGPSAWKRFGVAHAINIGDVFIPLGSLAVLESDYPAETKLELLSVISRYGLVVAEGQGLDINLRSVDPTEDAYVECTRKKTGAFFAMAVVGGAVVGGADPDAIDDLEGFASAAGVAFQIKDDVLDVSGGKGRRAGSDVLEGKRTLLVAHALAHAADNDAARLRAILDRHRDRTSDADVSWVLDLYHRTGAVRHAEAMAERLVDEALSGLVRLPETPAKYRFMRLSRHLAKRVR